MSGLLHPKQESQFVIKEFARPAPRIIWWEMLLGSTKFASLEAGLVVCLQ